MSLYELCKVRIAIIRIDNEYVIYETNDGTAVVRIGMLITIMLFTIVMESPYQVYVHTVIS